MSSDLISRQDAIEYLMTNMTWYSEDGYEEDEDEKRSAITDLINGVPSAQPEQTKMIKEIREWINSGNRGSADYFIVDKIEEIINKYE